MADNDQTVAVEYLLGTGVKHTSTVPLEMTIGQLKKGLLTSWPEVSFAQQNRAFAQIHGFRLLVRQWTTSQDCVFCTLGGFWKISKFWLVSCSVSETGGNGF